MFNPGAEPGPSKRRAPKTASGENKVSCTACRTVKCKCVEAADPSQDKCQRCERLNIACVYQAHQRGRRRKDGSRPHRRDEVSSPTSDATSPAISKRKYSDHGMGREGSQGHDVTRRRSSVTTGPSPATATPNGSAGMTPLRPSYQEPFPPDSREPHREVVDSKEHSRPSPDPDDHDHDHDYHRDIDHAPVNTVYHDVANRSIFSIAGVMDRKGGDDSPEYSTVQASNTKDDPVALGILTMAEVESLFGHYFDQLQTCVCLLDPAIHTARYTYRASSQLFSAVLTVASKFFRPELYDQSNVIANRLIDRAMSDCVCSIEIVQAICISHYWKKPQDGRGWSRLGHAIRLGYQLDSHLPRKDKSPADERKARLVIDRERTWISLFCFDSTQTELVDRPSMMMRAPDVGAWIREIPYPLPSDGQLDFAVKTSCLRLEVRQLQNCKGNYEILRSGLRRISEDSHRSHQILLSDEYPVKSTSTSVSINKFSTVAGQLLVECTSLSFAPKKHRISLMHACVSTSLDSSDIVVEGFVRKGIMPMIEDAHSVAVASTAVRLIRFLPYLDGSARAAVLRKMTKVVIVCREAARGDQESHPAYLARFIHASSDKAHQSRPPSRAPSPAAARQSHMTGMTPMDAPMPTPQQQKTTPDQWWDEIGQFAYNQEQPQLFKEHQDFWDGFPLLAGAMNTSTPAGQQNGVPPGTSPGGTIDPLAAPFAWDLDFLGIAQPHWATNQ